MGHGGPMGHGGGNKREGQDGAIGQHTDVTPGSEDQSELHRGRSATSPGHLKKEAGAQSARDYAPGRTNRGTAVLPDALPDETAED
jgi:hypothetical protein